jgi:hypothetical protein
LSSSRHYVGGITGYVTGYVAGDVANVVAYDCQRFCLKIRPIIEDSARNVVDLFANHVDGDAVDARKFVFHCLL